MNGQRLSLEAATELFGAISAGQLDQLYVAAALAALHARGESPDEIAGAAGAFRAVATPFKTNATGILDIVGTGGDGAQSINISSAASLVLASLGVKVAKHGNRSVSSKCGAADVLETFGFNLAATPEEAAKQLEEGGFTFLFAQGYHPAMRFVGPVRKVLANPTIFNLVGPLINPAPLTYQLMGVAKADYLPLVAKAQVALGRERSLVVNGDGLDEIALHGPTQIYETRGEEITNYQVTPADFGVPNYDLSELVGGDATENARLIGDVFAGRGRDAHRDAIAVNAAAAYYLTGGAKDLKSATAKIQAQLASGQVAQYLTELTGKELA
ncbi:anthranilate phosphoribosyltransferase [Boudabousia tangfeifanii]|uniref:Anthranilate phosphoribosyltransferase n=2 Tax=Boudabousia tangfeifanii TaxID=1912795 RepID=A0A1D9MMP0_9ACTO|nr:anthranilate phosphoribosyltransferase [Boudabousia tangfeifanii]